MLKTILTFLPAMLLGAQSIITLILIKGEICNGQKKRIYPLLSIFAVLWLAISLLHLEAFAITLMLFFTILLLIKTNNTLLSEKARQHYFAIGIWGLHFINLASFALIIHQIWIQVHLIASLHVSALAPVTFFVVTKWLLLTVLLGAGLAHLLLIMARTRLQAFHQILPLVGIISTLLLVMLIVAEAYFLGDTLFNRYLFTETALSELVMMVIINFMLVIVAVLVWSWPLFSKRKPTSLSSAISLMIFIFSLLGNLSRLVS